MDRTSVRFRWNPYDLHCNHVVENSPASSDTAIFPELFTLHIPTAQRNAGDASSPLPHQVSQGTNAGITDPGRLKRLIAKARIFAEAKSVYDAIPEGPIGDVARTHPDVLVALIAKASIFAEAKSVYDAIPEGARGDAARTNPLVLKTLIAKASTPAEVKSVYDAIPQGAIGDAARNYRFVLAAIAGHIGPPVR